ncbi:MAG: undecaprenyl-phosphate glucose phosphotransferase [Clostridia bacterium]|nr:undecaprenyl-phosphate glucose phosphotransferase [Clostridia bacterium]
MNEQNKSIFAMIENYLDMLINAVAIYVAYFFGILIIGTQPPASVNATSPSSVIWILVCVISGSFIYQAFNIYKTHIYVKAYLANVAIIKANLVYFGTIAIIVAIVAKGEVQSFLLMWVLLSAVCSTVFLAFKRNVILSIMMMLHKKQFILRKILVVGDNTASAKDFIHQVTGNPQYGMMVIGYLGNKTDPELACDKLGTFKDLASVIDSYKPTDVVFAIDAYDKKHLIRLVNICDDKCVKIYFLPVIYGFFKSEKQLEKIGSLPLINIHNTPLDNRANAVIKRIIDIIGSAILILVTFPLMLIVALIIKITSPGPVLFRQKRVGKMGEPFTMLKFRSMKVNDNSDDTWTTDTDNRKTKFGTFIRRTAIDELPQLFNVLLGSMSLVGPRPEIPKFVNEFKDVIPLYMVKHYVKPGMTGLAQIKGLRGDTSVEERIHMDIYYIENWSLTLDISILLRTPFKAFNKNEKYIETEIRELPELYGGPADPELQEIHELLLEEYGDEAIADGTDEGRAQKESDVKRTSEVGSVSSEGAERADADNTPPSEQAVNTADEAPTDTTDKKDGTDTED